MTWLRIDDGFMEHERIDPLTDKAFRLHMTAMCFCARNLTDGLITAKNAKVLSVRAAAKPRHIDELVTAGVWVSAVDGFLIRDYLDYNPTAEKVREDRRKAAERMKNVRANVQANVRPPRPVPSPQIQNPRPLGGIDERNRPVGANQEDPDGPVSDSGENHGSVLVLKRDEPAEHSAAEVQRMRADIQERFGA